jgi:hypothetical protein
MRFLTLWCVLCQCLWIYANERNPQLQERPTDRPRRHHVRHASNRNSGSNRDIGSSARTQDHFVPVLRQTTPSGGRREMTRDCRDRNTDPPGTRDANYDSPAAERRANRRKKGRNRNRRPGKARRRICKTKTRNRARRQTTESPITTTPLPITQEPKTTPPANCTRCIIREESKRLRIEYIKNEILAKLGFDSPPNITNRSDVFSNPVIRSIVGREPASQMRMQGDEPILDEEDMPGKPTFSDNDDTEFREQIVLNFSVFRKLNFSF